MINSKNINLILVGLAVTGIITHVIGNILDDKVYWIYSDIFSSVVFGMIGYRLIGIRRRKK